MNELIKQYITVYNLNSYYSFYQSPLDENFQTVTWHDGLNKEFIIKLYKNSVTLKASDNANRYHSANFAYIRKVDGLYISKELAVFLKDCGFTK